MMEKGPDSFSSHPECQMVLEKEVESLKISRSRLADKDPSHNDNNNKDNSRKMFLFPLEPNKGVGGMISGQNNNHQDLHCKPQNIEFPNVITQEAVWETAATAEIQPTTAERTLLQKVAREQKLKEYGRSEKSEDNASS